VKLYWNSELVALMTLDTLRQLILIRLVVLVKRLRFGRRTGHRSASLANLLRCSHVDDILKYTTSTSFRIHCNSPYTRCFLISCDTTRKCKPSSRSDSQATAISFTELWPSWVRHDLSNSNMSRDSSVGTAMGYRLNEVHFPAGTGFKTRERNVELKS
jgi:hypothetical protein